MMVEVADKELHFETVSRSGKVVDKGVLPKQEPPKNAAVGRQGLEHYPNQ